MFSGTLQRMFVRFAPVVALLISTGCGDDVPVFPGPDTGPQCRAASEDLEAIACPGDAICLGGRCFMPCSGSAQCSRQESCEEGVCVPRTGPRPDAGSDGGSDTGPCAELECEAPMVCDPAVGECVGCIDGTSCGGASPICDYATRGCVPFVDGLCSACNDDLDCGAGRRCTDRAGERVCLTVCDLGAPACPMAFSCEDSLCQPQLGTCTQIRNGVNRTACAADTDCVPRGAGAAPGTCGPDAVCLAACSAEVGCPMGLTCSGGPDPFCMGPPTM